MKKVKLLPVFLITISAVVLIIAQLAQAASVPIVSGTEASKSITSGTKMSVFNKMLEISYPKDNTLIDDHGLQAGDPIVSFTVYLPEGGSPDQDKRAYTLASNIYQVSVVEDVYRLLYPGQITLAYSANISPSVANQLSIWYSPDVNGSGRTWDEDDNINLGGITNVGQRTVTAPFQLSGEEEGYYAVFLGQLLFDEFTDKEDGSAWSYPYVTPLWAKGIIEPLPVNRDNNYFGLSTEVNRLEFATILVKGLGLPLSEEEPQEIFSDVDDGDEPDDLDTSEYFFDVNIDDDYNDYGDYADDDHYCIYDDGRMPVHYVETAVRNGIVSGYPDKTFRPAEPLTREQAAVIIGRAANLAVSDDMDKVRAELAKLFEDGADVSPWAAPMTLAAVKAGLIKGETGSTSKTKVLNPGDPLTRAQAATLTYNLLKKLKKI